MYNILPPYRKTSKSTIYSNNFQLVNRNVNPIILKNGDGKNSLFIIQGTIKFPHSRLSSHSKKKFPHSRLRRSWGNFSLLFLLSLSWGNSIVPFMIHREFLFPLLAPSAPRRGNIPSPFFKMMGLGQCCKFQVSRSKGSKVTSCQSWRSQEKVCSPAPAPLEPVGPDSTSFWVKPFSNYDSW